MKPIEIGMKVLYNGLVYSVEWVYSSGMYEIRRRHTVELVKEADIRVVEELEA